MATTGSGLPGGRGRWLAGLGVVGALGVAIAVSVGGPGEPVDGELAGADGVAAPTDEAPDPDAEPDGADDAPVLVGSEPGKVAAEQAELTALHREAERERAEEAAEAERREQEEAEREQEEAAEAEDDGASDQGLALVDAQERLIELGYLVGAADGEHGQQTSSAIMAFQAVNGLGVDGQLGPQTVEALAAPRAEPSLRGGPATRIEVDMDLQVLHLVEGDQRVTTMKVSTGRGGTFESEQGETLRAETPVGTFTVDRRIQGEHQSSYGIGGMWDPMYFHGPWAIHGSPSVPAGPASAGCVRVSMADGSWLFDRAPNGTHVVLYGGTHVFAP